MTKIALKAIENEMMCIKEMDKILNHLGKRMVDNDYMELETIFELSGLDAAIRCLSFLTEEYESKIRLFACDISDRVLFIWEEKYPDDKRPSESIRVNRAYAKGEASKEDVKNAESAAISAAEKAIKEHKAKGKKDMYIQASACAALAASHSSMEGRAYVYAQSARNCAFAKKIIKSSWSEDEICYLFKYELEYQKKLFLQYFGKDQP